jgi:TrmH family RNA methyltransferase
MGAIARVKVHYVDLPGFLDEYKKETGLPVYGTFLEGENIYGKALNSSGLIVMGNEGKGISSKVEERITDKLYIPNYPPDAHTSESLNVAVATAVVCSEFRRRLGE